MIKTFISYARADSARTLRLAQELRKAEISVWIDQLDIPPGARWDREIEAALKSHPGFIVCLSPAAVDSENVLDEVAYALDHRKTVVPILISSCDVPLRLRRLQTIDLTTNEAAGLERLKALLKSGVSVATAPDRPSSPPVEAYRPAPAQAAEPSGSSQGGTVVPADGDFGLPGVVYEFGIWRMKAHPVGKSGSSFLSFWIAGGSKAFEIIAGSTGGVWWLRSGSTEIMIEANGSRGKLTPLSFRPWTDVNAPRATVANVSRRFIDDQNEQKYTTVSVDDGKLSIVFGEPTSRIQGEVIEIDVQKPDISFTTCPHYGRKTFKF